MFPGVRGKFIDFPERNMKVNFHTIEFMSTEADLGCKCEKKPITKLYHILEKGLQ